MSKQNVKILVLSLSGIGNYIMQSPTIAALKKHWPESHITVWVAPRGTRSLAENDPNVDDVIESPIKLKVRKHIELTYLLARQKFDIGIMLSPGQLWKGAAYMFLAGIKKRIAHQYPFRNNPSSSFLLTDTVKEDPKLHDIEQNLNLLRLLSLSSSESHVTRYGLRVTSAHNHQANHLLSTLHIPDNATLIGIHPGSARGFEWKRWPLDNFAKLATLIKTNNAGLSPIVKGKIANPVFLIFGGPDEEPIKQELYQLIKSESIAACYMLLATDLLTTAAVMSRCSLFISNDSGLMHISAAVGTPTFGLFGPTDENQTGPRGPKSWSIRAPGTKPVYNTESGAELGSHPHPSITAITPEWILDVIKDKMQ